MALCGIIQLDLWLSLFYVMDIHLKSHVTLVATLLSHIGSQVKIRQSQSYKFKEFAKISNGWIFKQTLHMLHLLKLLDTMCKYEMDPTSIVEDTERTRFCPQTDRRTDGRTDRRTRWNQYTPFQLCWSGGIKRSLFRDAISISYQWWTLLITFSL